MGYSLRRALWIVAAAAAAAGLAPAAQALPAINATQCKPSGAQPGGLRCVSVLTGPNWVQLPTADALLAAYPSAAAAGKISGVVLANCVVRPDGTLACSVAYEEPAGYGLGQAALQLSTQYRMLPVTPTGTATAGAFVSLPFVFKPSAAGSSSSPASAQKPAG